MKSKLNRLLTITAALVLIPMLVAGAKEITTRVHKTAEFTKIEAGGVFKISFKVGPLAPVTIEAEDYAHEKIEVTVRGGVLKLSSNNIRNLQHDIKVTIVAPTLEGVDLSGAAAFVTVGVVKSARFTAEASGASEIQMQLEAENTDVEVSGAAKLTLKGKTNGMEAEVSGAGKFFAQSFLVDIADVDVSGAGHAEVNVSKNLAAEASGAGSISYEGGASVKSHTSGAGSIRNKN